MSLDAIFGSLEENRRVRADATALERAGGRRVTYGELAAELDALSGGLQAVGLRPGDAVVFSVRPSIEAVLLILAIERCGGVVVAADPGMSPQLFAARMAPLGPRWMMTESLLYALGRVGFVRAALERRGVHLPNFDLAGTKLILTGRLPRAEPGSFRAPDLDPTAPAFVVFTSGTTDAPKGVVHSRASIGSGLGMISDLLRLEPGDCVFSDQLHMIVPALVAGATAIIPKPGASPARTMRDMGACEATHLYAVPAQLEQWMRVARLPGSLRTVLLGSAPVPAGFLKRCRASLSPETKVYAAYAMTEMLPVSWVEMNEKIGFDGPGDLVGAPCAGVGVRIAPDGEIFLRGPNLCSGYLGCPPLTEVATGDIGVLSAGRLALLGRKKDMIIRGAYNIYPEMIESVVAGVPGVARCAMVGLYQEHLADELVVLAVQADDGVETVEVKDRVRRQLWESPQRIDVYARPDMILMTSVPVGGRSSKIDRSAVRELVRKRLEW